MKKRLKVLLMVCLLFVPFGCSTKEEKKPLEMMGKKEMDKLEVDQEIKKIEKEIDQEYLESKDLIAVYTFSYLMKLKDGSEKTGSVYSSEIDIKDYENEEGTCNYKLESVAIKKLFGYSYMNCNDPVGGAVTNFLYVNYYENHKKEIDNESVWYKVLLLPYDGVNAGFAFAPVLSKEKKSSLEDKGSQWIAL